MGYDEYSVVTARSKSRNRLTKLDVRCCDMLYCVAPCCAGRACAFKSGNKLTSLMYVESKSARVTGVHTCQRQPPPLRSAGSATRRSANIPFRRKHSRIDALRAQGRAGPSHNGAEWLKLPHPRAPARAPAQKPRARRCTVAHRALQWEGSTCHLEVSSARIAVGCDAGLAAIRWPNSPRMYAPTCRRAPVGLQVVCGRLHRAASRAVRAAAWRRVRWTVAV
jgi:hypothetical protein